MNDDQTSTADELLANNVDDYEEQHVSLVFIFLDFAVDINLSVNFISQINN